MAGFEDLSDPQLVVAIARFEEEALAEVYRRHGGAVLALAARVLADEREAEDVTQDILLRLWQMPDRFDPVRGSLRSFLLTMAHGRAVDLVRSREARRRRERLDAGRTPAVDLHNLERDAWDLGMAEHVQQALGELSGPEREAIELAYFDGCTYREVAAVLQQPEGTVKSRIRSGLRRMRSSLVAGGVGRP